MLKSHQQENCGELYPIATDIFEHFLSESGFTCTNITNGFDIHKKGEALASTAPTAPSAR